MTREVDITEYQVIRAKAPQDEEKAVVGTAVTATGTAVTAVTAVTEEVAG